MRVPRDPALPRLGFLLEPDAMAPILERSLGRPARLGDLRIARVSYKPGERVCVHYEAVVDGRREDAVARSVAGRDLESRTRHPRLLELAQRVNGRSPAANPLTYHADAHALLSWLPFDARLPALAEDLPQRLREAGLSVPAEPVEEPRRLAYKPGRRAVLRVGEHVVKTYASAQQFASAASALRAGSALMAIASPRCEAVDARLLLTAQEAVDGALMHGREGEVGALVRRLQNTDIPRLAPASSSLLEAATRKAALIGTVMPTLARRVRGLADRLARSAPPAPRLVPAHGDFHAGQLVRAGGDVYVLDLDSLCVASPALDLAEYAAGAAEAGAETAAAARDRLLAGYGARPGGLDWHLSAAILVRASHPFHKAAPAWMERVEELVAAAEEVRAE